MSRNSLSLTALVSIATILFAWTARAQEAQTGEPTADEALNQARQHHRVGVDAYADGRFAEAIEYFVAADRLRPSAALSFNIAKAYERLENVPRALAYYREYLHRSPDSAEDRESVNARVAELSRRLSEQGVQQVILRSTPPGAQVLVDSEPVGNSPVVVELRPGVHHAEFRHPDYETEKLDFELVAERPLDVGTVLVAAQKGAVATASSPKLTTEAAQPASTAALQTGQTSSKRSGSLTRTLGFAALGASVVALGGAVTFEVMRRQAENDARQEPEQVRFAKALDDMNSRQTVARVLAGAGGVLAAVGGVLVVLASTSEENKPRQGLALNCAPTRCTGTYSGSF